MFELFYVHCRRLETKGDISRTVPGPINTLLASRSSLCGWEVTGRGERRRAINWDEVRFRVASAQVERAECFNASMELDSAWNKQVLLLMTVMYCSTTGQNYYVGLKQL